MKNADTRPIKVLFVHHHGTPGGASSSLRYLIKNFPDGEVESHILTPVGATVDMFKAVTDYVYGIDELPEITSIAGGKHYYLRLIKTLLNLPALNQIEKRLLEIQPDIVHLNDLSLTLVAKTCKRLGFKVVMHGRVVLSDHVPFLNKIIQNYIEKYVDRVIAIDGSVAGKLNKIKKIDVVYNPLHIDKSFSVHTTTDNDNLCKCLFLANLITYKGIFDLLDAAVLLKEEKHIKFYIAGSNSRPAEFFQTPKGKVLSALGLVDDNESKIKKIVNDEGLENVIFLGHIKNINEWLQKTDVLIFPSHMNGPSRSVFEAGALGIPSVLALKDMVDDVVVNGKTGLVIPEKSPSKLAAAIKDLASNPEKRRKMGDLAKVHFNQLNDPQLSARKVLDVYAKVLLKSEDTF